MPPLEDFKSGQAQLAKADFNLLGLGSHAVGKDGENLANTTIQVDLLGQ